MNYTHRYETYKTMIEKRLNSFFCDSHATHAVLLEAMRYSLLAGGKRVRPVLTLELCRLCGGVPEDALEPACAVEMLHTYSLIHDDLPCMDDDDLRRGKPSNHAVYGEMTAVLAGDALQAAAFKTILSSDLSARTRAECAMILAQAAGESGICAGQYIDMISEGKQLSEREIMEIHGMKTSALIEAACLMGAAAGGAGEAERAAAAKYARALGLAFQIRDDALDAIGDEKLLGKPRDSDKRGGKTTFMSLYGERGCEEIISSLIDKAKLELSAFKDPEFLSDLADSMAFRQY